MKDHSQLNESALQYLDKDYFYSTNENNIVFYKMKIPEASIPAVTESILIDKNYHVKLYFKGCLYCLCLLGFVTVLIANLPALLNTQRIFPHTFD